MNKLPIIEVDLGNYGVQEIEFSDYVEVSSDLVQELQQGAGNFAYISSVERALKQQVKQKQLEFESFKGQRTSEITAEILAEGKKATVKAVDAELAQDDALLRFKEELMLIEDKADSVGDLLNAMRMKHSNVKKLVELTINGMAMGRTDVKVEPEKPYRVKKEVNGKGRGRKSRKDKE